MIRSTRFKIIFTFLVFVVYQNHSWTQISPIDHDHTYCKRSYSTAFFSPMAKQELVNDDIDLVYYRLEWEIDPTITYIQGTATPYFKVLEEGLTSVKLELANNLMIDQILWRGQKLSYIRTGSFDLDITLPEALAKNTLDSLSIQYKGAPVAAPGGLGSFTRRTHGVGSNVQPIIWTLSVPYGSRDWWPCKNGLTDKIDSLDIFIKTDQKYRAASNGVLMGETEIEGGKKVAHWRHRHSIVPYLVCFSVTNYAAYTDTVRFDNGGSMPMLNYVYPESLEEAKKGTAANVDVLRFYDSLFIDYPYKNEKYGHAQFGWGGGMEHQTMSFVTDFSFGLLAHELGHQWFGDYVTCAGWDDVWLNEGFATYLEGLSRERFPNSGLKFPFWLRGKINSVTSDPNGSVKVSQVNSVSRIFNGRLTYDKGGLLVHMLRWVLGDEALFKGLRSYLNTHANDFASTNDLKKALETASGKDLTGFFKDWYEGQGYPTYKLAWDQGGNKVVLKLNQTTSHNSVDFFEMPVQIRLRGDNVEKWVVIDHRENAQEVEIEVDFNVTKVDFDPNLWIISKNSVVREPLISSITDISQGSVIKMFPNPCQDILFVEVSDPSFESYTIIQENGKKCFDGALQKNTPSKIDLSHLPTGKYLIQLENGRQLISQVILKTEK